MKNHIWFPMIFNDLRTLIGFLWKCEHLLSCSYFPSRFLWFFEERSEFFEKRLCLCDFWAICLVLPWPWWIVACGPPSHTMNKKKTRYIKIVCESKLSYFSSCHMFYTVSFLCRSGRVLEGLFCLSSQMRILWYTFTMRKLQTFVKEHLFACVFLARF